MQPNVLTVNGANYRIYTDENGINFHAAHIEQYARRGVSNLQLNRPKIIDFDDLPDYWSLESLYISSPDDSEVLVEILNENDAVIFQDLHRRNTVPKTLPTVLIDSSLRMRLTARRSPIGLLLLYLRPVHLAYSKDF